MSTSSEIREAIHKWGARANRKDRPHCKCCPLNIEKCKQGGCSELHDVIALLEKATDDIESEAKSEKDREQLAIVKAAADAIKRAYYGKSKE